MSNYKMNDQEIRLMYSFILASGEEGVPMIELKHMMAKLIRKEPNVESNLSRMDNQGLLLCEDQNRIFALETFYNG